MSARGAHRSKTALGPRPGVLTLQPVAATPELRTERSSCSSRLEESGLLAAGQTGARGEGAAGRAALTRVCAAPRSGVFLSGDRPRLQLPFPQNRSWELRRPCAYPLSPVAAHACALAPAATHTWELAPAAAHSCALAPGPVGVGGAFVSLRTPGWNILILYFLKVFDLISVF